MIKWRQVVHILLLVLLILLLMIFDTLEAHLKEIASTTFKGYPLIALYLLFPVVFGIMLFGRYYISSRCNYKRPIIVWLCVLVIMSVLVVFAYQYYFINNTMVFGIILWTETLCEFLSLRVKRKK
jgi:hypothetical protein